MKLIHSLVLVQQQQESVFLLKNFSFVVFKKKASEWSIFLITQFWTLLPSIIILLMTASREQQFKTYTQENKG